MKFNFRTASMSADQRREKLDALNADFLDILNNGGVGKLASEAGFQYKAAALFREVVLDTFAMTDPTPIFADTRPAALGDTVEFTRLINTLKVVKYAPMSQPLIFTPRKMKYTVSTAQYEQAVGIDLQSILTRQHTVAEFAAMSAEALMRHNVELVLTAVDTACAQGTTDIHGRDLSENIAGAEITKEALDAQIRRLGVYQSGVTIFGSRFALDPIFDFGAVTEDLKNELNGRGLIGTYRGARIVAIQDDYNDWQNSFTKINGVEWDKLVFLAGATRGATLVERDISALNWQELNQEKAWFRTGVRFDHGIMVHSPWRYAVLRLDSGY